MNAETQEAKEELKELFFSIYYDAEDTDLVNHRLPADRVADAIKQMYTLVSEADKTLNGNDSTIELFVSAPAEQGSLGIEFFAELINPQNAQIVLQALGVITTVGGLAKGALTNAVDGKKIFNNVFDIAQEINGATTIDVETFDDSDVATLKINEREVHCEETAARLIGNPKIRKAVHDLVTKPIEGYKNPSISIGKDAKNEPATKLDDQNIEKIIKVLAVETEPKPHNQKAVVTFTQVNFDSPNGWKMRLNGKQVGVKITDEAFIKRINDSRQKFSKSDEDDVELIRRTFYNASGTEKTSYNLIKANKKAKLQ